MYVSKWQVLKNKLFDVILYSGKEVKIKSLINSGDKNILNSFKIQGIRSFHCRKIQVHDNILLVLHRR